MMQGNCNFCYELGHCARDSLLKMPLIYYYGKIQAATKVDSLDNNDGRNAVLSVLGPV